MAAPTAYPLCVADDATFWPWVSWPAFRDRPDKERTVVVLPLAGFMAANDDAAFDEEEDALMPLLADASRQAGSPRWLLVLPPLRFVAGPDPRCAFPVPPPVAHALIADLVGSVAAAGFRRVLLFNASPWNEEICAAAARDLRLEKGLDMFCLNLAALGPSPTPARVAALLAELHAWRPPPV